MDERAHQDAHAIELMTRWTLVMLQNAERGLIPVRKLERFVDPSVLAALGPITPRLPEGLPFKPQVGRVRVQVVHDELAHVACVAGRPDGQLAGYVLEFRRAIGERGDWHITEMTRAEERLLVTEADKVYARQPERRRLPRDLSGLIASTERAREDAHAALERAEVKARDLRDRIAQVDGHTPRRMQERQRLRDQERQARLTAARWQRAIKDIDQELKELHEVAELRDARKLVVERDPLLAVRDPQHLERLLGPIPADRETRKAWRRAASAVERYRQRWNISHHEQALDHPPADAPPERRRDHAHAAEAANAYRVHRSRHRSQARDTVELTLDE